MIDRTFTTEEVVQIVKEAWTDGYFEYGPSKELGTKQIDEDATEYAFMKMNLPQP